MYKPVWWKIQSLWGLCHNAAVGKNSINMCWWKGTSGSICQSLTHHCKLFAFWHAHTSMFKRAVCFSLLPQGQFLLHLTHSHILTTDKSKEKHTSLYSHTHTTSFQKPFGAQPRTQYRMTEKKSYCSSVNQNKIASEQPQQVLIKHATESLMKVVPLPKDQASNLSYGFRRSLFVCCLWSSTAHEAPGHHSLPRKRATRTFCLALTFVFQGRNIQVWIDIRKWWLNFCKYWV